MPKIKKMIVNGEVKNYSVTIPLEIVRQLGWGDVEYVYCNISDDKEGIIIRR